MNKSSTIWVVVIVVVIVIVGLWWAFMPSSQSPVVITNTSSSTTSMTSSTGSTGSTGTTTGTPIQQATSSFHALTLRNSGGGVFGSYLSATNGMTLYQSTKDSTNVSNCTGTCSTTWPPYTVSASVAATLTADPGIAGKIATIKRSNGTLQVTYRGLPLYYYSGDAKSGDTKGEALNGFTQVAP